MRAFTALTFICLMITPLAAEPDLRPQEAARLDRYEQTVGNALLQALARGKARDVAALTQALSGTPQVAFDQSLSGEWRCRTLKLGGPSALTVYTNFKCTFTIEPDGFVFEKRTGSQRTKGKITYREGSAIYVGMGYVADATAPDYADLPDDFISNDRIQTQIAIFERVNETRARLLFPAPLADSDFDILELTR
jgi:hypothetical protein